MATSLAEEVRAIFEKFNTYAKQSNDQRPVTILTTWRRTLFDSSEDDTRFYDAMAMAVASVYRLSAQINSSKELGSAGKKTAAEVVSGFLRCMQPDLFPQTVHSQSRNFNEDRLGSMDIFASALRREFPESEIAATTIAELIKEVKAVRNAIGHATIDPDLKAILLQQTGVLLWTLEHATFSGRQNIKDSVARIAVTTLDLPATEPVSEGKPRGPTLRSQLSKTLRDIAAVLKIARDTDDGLTAIEHLAEGVVEAIDDITSAL